MTFIFAETTGLQSAATAAASLADETASAGTQGHAAGLPVVPPGLDPVSLKNATHIKAFTSSVGSALGVGSQLQESYSASISNARAGYLLTDELNAAGISQAGATVPSGLV